MNEHELSAAVLNAVNDGLTVTAYGHGHLLVLPYTYYDEDRVVLFVEAFEDGVRVTDRGATAVRLQSSDLNLDSTRIRSAWERSIGAAQLFNPAGDDLELAHWSEVSALGESALKVAEASLRIDQLRWAHQSVKPPRLRQQVVSVLRDAARTPDEVLAPSKLTLRSGRQRQVTASVGLLKTRQVVVQAVGGQTDRDRAVEHCHYLFQLAKAVPKERRLAFAEGSRASWPEYSVTELEEVCTVAFLEDDHRWLEGYLARETEENSLA